MIVFCVFVGKDYIFCFVWLLLLCENGFKREGFSREGMFENRLMKVCGRVLFIVLG